jgi:hypothetical protein
MGWKSFGSRSGSIAAILVVGSMAATAIAADTQQVDPGLVALRAFELRVNAMHAVQLARHESDGGEEPAEEAPNASETARLRLRSVLDRMAVSTRWQVEQDSWRAGIRLRFSRSVEFDAATHTFAVLEAIEITPAVRFKIVSLARGTTVLVRRTGYANWERALFARPSRWLFGDWPDHAEEAEQIAPGTAITFTNETEFFVGADLTTHVGSFPLRVHAGPFASGQSFTRLERLAGGVETTGDRQWVISVGGLMPRGFETAVGMRTPDLVWGKSLRILETHWRSSRGFRFMLRAGPLDLKGNPEAADFLRVAMAGVAPFRFYDVPLLGASLRTVGRHREIGPDLFERLGRFPNFKRLRAAADDDPVGIPFVESISRFSPRKHGEMGIDLWAGIYGLNLTSNWYAEESLGAPSGRPASTILSFPMQRRWDRGWLFFPRETQDLQMITVIDAQGEDLITEVSLEIEDARAHRSEGRVYREQIRSFITPAVVEKFPRFEDTFTPAGPRAIRGELPDLTSAPAEVERVSIYLRIILGPRFHEQLLLGAKDVKERKRRITAFQTRIGNAIRRRGDALDELVRASGEEDLFVSFRIAITPYARRKESPRPTTVFSGRLGDPERIQSYRRLRDAFDAAGTIF